MGSCADIRGNSKRWEEAEEEGCPESEDGEHEYEVTNGSPPSCEYTCKHCGDTQYTK